MPLDHEANDIVYIFGKFGFCKVEKIKIMFGGADCGFKCLISENDAEVNDSVYF